MFCGEDFSSWVRWYAVYILQITPWNGFNFLGEMANGNKGRSGGTAGSGKEPVPSLTDIFYLDEIASFDIWEEPF